MDFKKYPLKKTKLWGVGTFVSLVLTVYKEKGQDKIQIGLALEVTK